jgi:hypothetical protein
MYATHGVRRGIGMRRTYSSNRTGSELDQRAVGERRRIYAPQSRREMSLRVATMGGAQKSSEGPSPGRARSTDADGATPQQVRLARLRSSDEEESGSRILLATLKIRIPRNIWTGPFSSRHPAIRLEVLNRTDVSGDVSVSDYWISGGVPGEWALEIGSFSDVLRVDSLAMVGDGCLYRIKYRNPPVIGLYRRLRLPLQFPLRIQAGILTWEVVARYAEFRRVMEHARRADANVQVTSVRRRPLRSHLPQLTDSQHALLTEAMSAGYFAVPRRITLTELAKKLDRSKSSISEGIAVIEKKLVESALSAGSIA